MLVFTFLPLPLQQMGFLGHKNVPIFRSLDSLSLGFSVNFVYCSHYYSSAFCVSMGLILAQFIRINPIILIYVIFFWIMSVSLIKM